MAADNDRGVFPYFITLITLFFVGFGGLAVLDYWLGRRLDELEAQASNERARRAIGAEIVGDIKNIQLDFMALAVSNTDQGSKIVRDDICTRISMIQEALAVLEKGGTVQRKVALNLKDRDEMVEDLVFVPPDGTEKPLELIELEPKLVTIEQKADELLNLVDTNDTDDSPWMSDEILLFVKKTSPFFLRMTEHANRLLFDSRRRLFEIEESVRNRRRNSTLIEIFLICLVVAAVLILSVVIGSRVRHIIAMQRKADMEIRASEKKLKDILNTVQNGVILIDQETHCIVDANPAALRMMAASWKEVIGSDCRRFFGREGEDSCPLKNGGSFQDNSERTLINARGEEIPVLKSAVFVRTGGESFILESFFDISDRKKMEEALRIAKEEWERTFDALPDLICILDPDHQVIRANRAFCEKMGLDLTTGAKVHCFECVHQLKKAPSFCPHLLTIRDHQRHEIELSLESIGGDFSILVTPLFDQNGSFIGSVHVARDVTERNRAEQERLRLEQKMQHTQKLESLGVMAGGIAHDFNNILMAILGHSDLALHELPASSPAREDIEEIQRASTRAADLCRQMLAYSGKGKFVVEAIDFNEIIDEMMHFLKTSISKKARLKLDFSEKLPLIQGDATEIRQIVMNLVINASEALGEDSGDISIATTSMRLRRETLDGLLWGADLPAGEYVSIEVGDTGCGMEPDIISKLFEPFFTTKFTGRGLGMSAVSGIIRGHQGAMEIVSDPGKGTFFRVFFPALKEKSGRRVSAAPPVAHASVVDATVLLVDDEEAVRTVGKNMLRKIGYHVIIASDGPEALNIFNLQGEEIDIVILDLTMPGLSGEETLDRLKDIRSNVPVIISSGFSVSDILPNMIEHGSAGFLQKPYTMETLKEELQRALDPGR